VCEVFGQQANYEGRGDGGGHRGPPRRAKLPRGAVVRVGRGEGNHTTGSTIVIDALQDARALAGETLGRESLVCLLRHGCADLVEGSDQIRSSRLAGLTRFQVRPVRRGDLDVEADLDEPIVGQVRMAHTTDLVAA